MEALEVPEHEHPLKLIDLQLQYPEEEEDDDDDDADGDGDGDLITKESFHGVKCGRCCHEIHMYHRYYYKCTEDSSCHFSLHKFCAELSTRLEHTLHRHPLIQRQMDGDWLCCICKCLHQPLEMCYDCSECNFAIDVNCAVEVGKKVIYHPCHPHVLMCAIPKPILCDCSACGKRHEGIFYQCTICVGFTIHNDCAFLPKTLLIQQTTDKAYYHTHPLTISYSFPLIDQRAKHDPKCRVCNNDFVGTEDLWIYKCNKCMYYTHVECISTKVRRDVYWKEFQVQDDDKTFWEEIRDVYNPDRLHLPFPDETYSIPKHLFFQENRTSAEVKLTHLSHQHPLVLVDQSQTQTSSKINSLLLMCHNPMKKIQLLCNGCLRPIMATMPFYMCTQLCNFALHEWCTRLPEEIKNHPAHPYHTLLLMYSKDLPFFLGVFYCDVCELSCNGFAYCCVECKYRVDVNCGLIPKKIVHEAHPDHLLSIVRVRDPAPVCNMCLQKSYWKYLFYCRMCGFCMHPACAFLIHKAIRHKYDEHPMHLSYLPIENHKSEYFCEICEHDLNPHQPFYHCKDCAQSVHAACASLILQCETETYTRFGGGVHLGVNLKFGSIHNTHCHPHLLSFAQGTDGQCSSCHEGLQYKLIFKCLDCKFSIDFLCYERLSQI